MKFQYSLPYFIAAAGLVQVGGSPIRIVASIPPNTPVSDVDITADVFRLGRPAVPDVDLGTIMMSVPRPLEPMVGAGIVGSAGSPRRHRCGKLREKALAISNSFRKALGMTLIEVDEVKFVRISSVHHPGKPQVHHHHGHHRHHHHHHPPGAIFRAHHHRRMDHPFVRRLHFALSSLGPWEGRAVAFVIGCGIGVLLRMLWVLAVISYRFVRGNNSSEGEYQHILFEQYDAEDLVVPPPAFVYVDEKAPIQEVASEKETETK
jgi:hypothetical protein